MELIDKSAIIAEIEKLKSTSLEYGYNTMQKVLADSGKDISLGQLQYFIDTLEVKDPYEQCVQYDSIKAGIQAHAETYSFNIESELFNQLTKEQQALWRKEIEQACISGGEVGVELARDIRYKENVETKKVDLEKEIGKYLDANDIEFGYQIKLLDFAKHFFGLGMQVNNKKQKGEEI